jgi:hypothetical protein
MEDERGGGMRDNGKGDTPRPLGVPMEVFDKNFEAIFGKKKPTQQENKDDNGNQESEMGNGDGKL